MLTLRRPRCYSYSFYSCRHYKLTHLASLRYERALVEFGVSLGATATGLLLLRMADPDGRTPVLREFTFKQVVHVMVVGGGFFDALALPLVKAAGSVWALFGAAAAAIVVWAAVWRLTLFPSHTAKHARRYVAGGGGEESDAVELTSVGATSPGR